MPVRWLMTQQPPEEEPGPWQAKVFVAYASEDYVVFVAIQEAIRKYIKDKAGATIRIVPWEEKVHLTESILQSVKSGIVNTDFGIFIYSPVDGKARDNVVFETGLSIGLKGAARTVLLLPEKHDVAPSDLLGIIGVKYPYTELKAEKDASAQVNLVATAGALIASKILTVMTETSASEEQPGAAQPGSGASEDRPSAALDIFNAGWTMQAALGGLGPLKGDIFTGKFVVHAASGIGQVVGFDPPEAKPRYVEVRFGSVIARYRAADLFEPPIAFR